MSEANKNFINGDFLSKGENDQNSRKKWKSMRKHTTKAGEKFFPNLISLLYNFCTLIFFTIMFIYSLDVYLDLAKSTGDVAGCPIPRMTTYLLIITIAGGIMTVSAIVNCLIALCNTFLCCCGDIISCCCCCCLCGLGCFSIIAFVCQLVVALIGTIHFFTTPLCSSGTAASIVEVSSFFKWFWLGWLIYLLVLCCVLPCASILLFCCCGCLIISISIPLFVVFMIIAIALAAAFPDSEISKKIMEKVNESGFFKNGAGNVAEQESLVQGGGRTTPDLLSNDVGIPANSSNEIVDQYTQALIDEKTADDETPDRPIEQHTASTQVVTEYENTHYQSDPTPKPIDFN